MYYVVYSMTSKDMSSKVFDTYDEAYKEAKKLASKCGKYDYILLTKVKDYEEKTVRLFSSY